MPETITSYDEIPLILSVYDLAKALHIGKNTAYGLVNSGKIRCLRIGTRIRIPREAFREYVESL